MTDVRIGVKAETHGMDAGMNRTDQQVNKVKRSVEDLGKAAKNTASEIDKIEEAARHLGRIQRMLSSEMGQPVSPAQTRAFVERMERNERRNQHEAQQRQQSSRGSMVHAGMGSMKHMAGSMLAFAGITGAAAMAGKAIDLARSEALANDQLLRSVGDLKITFMDMRSQVRASTEGLGVAFVEAAAMAKQFVKESNAKPDSDIYGNLRTGIGMGRAYGFDPAIGVGFLAQMKHVGAMDSSDKNGRRMALMIAEAIQKGGVTAKADEVLSAVADFSSQVAKMSLSAPNVAAFAGSLSSLTSMHIPGLDPRNAASMLMTADASMRRGGALGEASMNLTYGAMNREYGNINPILAMGISEQGLFGTGAGFAKSSLGKWYSNHGMDLSGIKGSNVTNFEMVRRELELQYGANNPMLLNAFQRQFGLQSQGQAAAMLNMKTHDLGGVAGLVEKAGLNVNEISATGIQNLAEIGTSSGSGLRSYAQKLLGRDDLSDSEKGRLSGLMGGSGPQADEALRVEMARIVSTREQEKNDATDIRDGITDIEKTLTRIGAGLLPAIATIQEAVVAMAETVIQDESQKRKFKGLNEMPEYMRKRHELDQSHALAREQDEMLRAKNTSRFGKKYADMDFSRREGQRRRETLLLENEYKDSVAIAASQALATGGSIPAGNPAGSASSQPTVKLEVTSRLIDSLDKLIGVGSGIENPEVTIPLARPQGSR